MSKKIFKLSLTLVILVVTMSACTLPWKKKAAPIDLNTASDNASSTQDNVISTNQLKKFSSYDDLKIFLEGNKNTGANLSNVNTTSNNGISLSYPTSDDQSVGNNKADIVKNDGSYVYSLVRNDLKISKINPASESALVNTISFKSRPQNIILNGTNLVVFGVDQQIASSDLYKSFRRQNPYMFVKVYDLSDPANPVLVRDLNFEGDYSDARLIGDYVYLFTDTTNPYIENEPILPRVVDNGAVLSSDCGSGGKCFAPDIYYFDIPYNSYHFANVTAINVKDNNEAISGESYILDNSQSIYVSQSNLYISYTQTLNENDLTQSLKRELVFAKLSSDDQAKINKIDTAADYILSHGEKQEKVSLIINTYLNSLSAEEKTTIQNGINDALKQKINTQSKDIEKTFIYKIAVNGNKVEYRGMGSVNGQILEKSAINENGDYLRIATVRSKIWSLFSDKPNESNSNIYILDNGLNIIGSLENVVTPETITGARFMGNRLYLITTKQADPLYVIGLSDPTKPVALGAIKVPESSTFLQPADADGNKLIGFGLDTTTDTNGATKVNGLKLSLFDFSDLSQPKELNSYLINNADANSVALQDRSTFFYSEAKNLLSVPAVLKENNKISFAGSFVFLIANNQLVLKGKIDHSEGGNFLSSDFWNGYEYYDNTVKRSFYLNDNLFTFSNKFLKINTLIDLKTVKNVMLTSNPNDYIISPAATTEQKATINNSASSTDEVITPSDVVTPATDTVQTLDTGTSSAPIQ